MNRNLSKAEKLNSLNISCVYRLPKNQHIKGIDLMPTITITGDTTQKALEQLLYEGIGRYGKDFNVVISENLRFENQNKEIKEYKQKLMDAYAKLGA